MSKLVIGSENKFLARNVAPGDQSMTSSTETAEASRPLMETNTSDWPLPVQCIKNSPSQRHSMFDNAPVHYEPRSQRDTTNSQLVERADSILATPPPPRPEYTDLRAMKVLEQYVPSCHRRVSIRQSHT